GEPLKCLRGLLEGFPLEDIRGVARTGSGGQSLPLPGVYLDPIVAGLEGARKLAPDARNILSIGGGSFSLTQLDEGGRYRRSNINSACASGTGAFLDQQALRLQIPPAELAQCAMCYEGRPPGVATRCAVFAKSDMIHLQQEGFSVEAIAAGLCVGLGASTVDGLLDGRALTGKSILIGGMARNSVVVRAIREKLGVETVVPDFPELAGAYGAALVALQQGAGASLPPGWVDRLGPASGSTRASGPTDELRAPLELKLSSYPAFTWHDHWVNEDDSEVAIVAPQRGAVRVALGIDIGSTSTKATALDEQNQVVGWVYRKTAGNPIRAVQLVFKAFREMEKRGGFTLDIRGVGTTGSGRKMIKEVIGADLAMNEITAHARAAVFIDPEADTIIELGGQDAKFTQLQNGMVYNSVMNYVCAAGTGSFIEEQALKLGLPLAEYAGRAMGKPCPRTSDRCTVYMERDLDLLMARGWSKDQIAAAVLHSVRDNYLNKVVGGLYIGDHIYFQGATARNKALVAAFEVELQKPIAVSPYCHLTGSLGMSLLARERVPEAERSARFKGLAFADEKVTVDHEICDLCHNLCNLSIIRAGQEVVAWGLKCGRDYGEKRMRVRDLTAYESWKRRAAAWANGAKPSTERGRAARPRIGLLRSLGTYGYYPFWRTFLRELGGEVVYSPVSSEKILHRGGEISTAEYCAPVVMSHGHARALLEDSGVDYLFVPHMLREPVPNGFTDAHFCCYVQAHPGVLKSIEGLNLGR
ncbi:MAG: CoA activase, partial [Verrucomicrobia bacterium]|nr:CoA activase [Verrucomicrobiota bacterium]